VSYAGLCYDDVGDLVPCEDMGDCPGQDGFYAKGCQLQPLDRFEVVNGGADDPSDDPFDDVVKDKCTGLMWTRAMADVNADNFVTNDGDLPDWETAFA